jgi:Zn-dependent protease
VAIGNLCFTPMALSFRLGKIPVRILPSFFLMTVLINMSLLDRAPQKLVVWTLVVLASVLLHELGHAATCLAFGLEPSIALHAMGGTTSWSTRRDLSTGRRVAISLAGPGAGFLAGVAVMLAAHGLGPAAIPTGGMREFAYESLLYVNIAWGALNLLPMLPLDGGNAMTQVLNGLTNGRGERPARIVSIAIAAGSAILSFYFLSFWPALLALSFMASNWRGLRDLSDKEHDAPMRASLEQAYSALDAKDAGRVLSLARPIAVGSRTAPVRAEALQLMAFGFLLEGRVAEADAAIASLPKGFAPHASLLELRAGAELRGT